VAPSPHSLCLRSTRPFNVAGLDHIGLKVPHMDRSLPFHRVVLGLEMLQNGVCRDKPKMSNRAGHEIE
jgi:hypothetical protein